MTRIPTPAGGLPAIHLRLPAHLQPWTLPPDWHWGDEGLALDHRHYQKISDALGRSLSLVSSPDRAHRAWLDAEARTLAQFDHPSVPTTYHYWTGNDASPRGPGYLRRWIAGETVGARLRRAGAEGVGHALLVLRTAGSALAYLHDMRVVHGAVSGETLWSSPTGRLWLIGWQWAVPQDIIPTGLRPDPVATPDAPEWDQGWAPTTASDQWQLAHVGWSLLVGEPAPRRDVPPLRLVAPDAPTGLADAIDRALHPDPAERHPSVAALLRAVDRVSGTRSLLITGAGAAGDEVGPAEASSDEARVRWVTGDDYEVIAPLGRGSFGSVWRVRDLSLGREVALKVLHPEVARDERVVARFRREARLTAQLSHPAIVPIYDWDQRGAVSFYTMELAEGGSLAQLVAQKGPRLLVEVAPQVHAILDALAAAHGIGIIHRDLKPENILIDRWFRWRITDFGIANVAGEENAGASGTPAFAAPEQLLGEPQGPPADLFALGAIVHFALDGRPPFEGREPQAILARQLEGSLDLSGFHPAVAAWLRTALAPQADDRFPDAVTTRAAWLDAVEVAIEAERAGDSWWSRLVRGLGSR
ncbi:MAG: protein kinase domain-containing protein [Gemmatimonadota bacterium]|nr:protein kinase [Gemmatimonadota bacterium]